MHRWLAALTAALLLVVLVVAGGPGPLPFRATSESDVGRTDSMTIDVHGQSRHVLLHRPGRAGDHLPLVVVLHGAGSTGAAIEADTGLSDLADRWGFAVAYPDGLHGTWNAGGCCLESVADQVDDLGFLSLLVDRLAHDGLADRARVFVTGFSNGGMMAARVACEVPGILGLAMVAGAQVSPCTATSVATVLLVHGTLDRMVPVDGYDGVLETGQHLTYPPLADTAATWRRLLACTDDPDERATDGYRVRRWAHCARGQHVEVAEVVGMGHAWPGNRAIPTPDDQGFDATGALLRSFGLGG